MTILAFVPLYLAVASLTRHTLRVTREEVARALGRAVAGRLADDVASGRDDTTLQDVARVSVDESHGGDGVVAIRVLPAAPRPAIEVGQPETLATLRTLPLPVPGEHVLHANAPDVGPILAIDVARTGATVQVALRVGDQASRAAPLLRLVAFYTGAFAFVLVVFAYLLLGRLIVRPIAALVTATRRIADSGPASARRLDLAPISGAAEVVELGRAIARTTGRLVEREEALAAKVAQLEAARSDLLAARDAIVRSERLASVGRLAAGLAHEVGNPIAALLGLEEVVLTGELDDETRDLVERMKRETERVHRVMRDLLDFARAEQEPRASEASASASVREVAEEVAALVKPQRSMRDVVVKLEIPRELHAVRIAGTRLQQVLLNLVLNAGDALGDEAKRRGIEPRGEPIGTIVVRARTHDEHTVRLEVEDDGPGVPEAVRDKLFEPFVTTKDVGKGTGLGLAVCRGLVEGVGGRIDLDRTPKGARFLVDLPTVDAPARPKSIAPPPGAL
ncbi:MAG: HAMP domain-containing histidine kinase [Sandaracinaceae bacterium]|nr:HAMP domain-containing histidine kinase [Sandaracinaceae bacterium]